MKIKKVEISAFRIYDNPQDATFDLTTKSGNVAGFVSLYAPNGFGKTSFYDAVEYGMTSSINRFFMKNKELEKLADFQHEQNNITLIRNSKSSPDLQTYVKIYTTNREEPIFRVFKKHGNQTHEINFKKPIVHGFQKVILSQEWVSAFLTERDGEFRYSKFMENPALSGIDEYYNKLRHLYTACLYKEEELKKEIYELEQKIEVVSSENILGMVNTQIQRLAEHFGEEKLQLLSLDTTQEEVKKFKDFLVSKVVANDEETSLRKLLEYVSIAKSGDKSIPGVQMFFAFKIATRESEKSLLEIKKQLDKFKQLDKYEAELESMSSILQKSLNAKQRVSKILSDFVEYESILKEIRKKENLISETENLCKEKNSLFEEFNRKKIQQNNEFKIILKQIEELKSKKNRIPQQKKDLEDILSSMAKINNDLSELHTQIPEKEKELTQINKEIEYTQEIIDEISEGKYPEILKEQNHALYEKIKHLQNCEDTILKEQDTFDLLNNTIQHQQTLNQTITDFIKTGLTIVDQQQTTTCPLCEQVYDSYNILVERITNNKALDKTLKTLLSRKSESESLILKYKEEIKKNREILVEHYNQQFDSLSKQRQILLSVTKKLKQQADTFSYELSVFKKKKADGQVELQGLSFENYEVELSKKIKKFESEKDLLAGELANSDKKIYEVSANILSFNDKIDLLKKEIGQLRQNEKLLFVTNWFNEFYPDKDVNLRLVEQRQAHLTKSIQQVNERKREHELEIKRLSEQLSSLKKENLLKEKSDLEVKIREQKTMLVAYHNYLKDNLGIDMSELDDSALSNILDEKFKHYNTELDKLISVRKEYQKLEKYSDNIWSFLQTEKTKQEIFKKRDEIRFLSEKIEPEIQKERNKTREYLESKIKDFFHEDLINKLYSKIDPHPDFKSVEFKANFDVDNPRLDVFVRNVNDEHTLIPNLYFSTAQINVLSLSIFLATALNSKDYQCIFIDDPIQSMDSINVLSTIDLFRSIVVNEGKQIILSTHDANFHNLLKKKIPSNHFESKFIELESFGKVKQG